MMNDSIESIENRSTSQDVMKDAGVEASDMITAEVPTPTTKAFFTEGEMLPWKGRWFRVHLVEQGEQSHIQLFLTKPTSSSMKRGQREARWLRSHPRSDRAKAVRIAAKLRESLQHLLPASPSVEA